MVKVYLNTLILVEAASFFGLLAFTILVYTGLYELSTSYPDVIHTLNGTFLPFSTTFQHPVLIFSYDIVAGNGCLASDLSILSGYESCVRDYCSGIDYAYNGDKVLTLLAGSNCTFDGVLRFIGGG